jgi:hypothetical protein
MLTLLTVVVTVAVGVAVVSRVEPARSRGSFAVAALSIVVGCLAGGLWTDCLAESAIASMAADEPESAPDAGAESTPAETQPKETSSAASESANADSDKDEASAPSDAPAAQAPAPSSSPAETKPPAAESTPATAEPSVAAATPGQVSALSAPLQPVTNVEYLSKNRPAWLESKPVIEQDQVRVAVKAGPYFRMRQCLTDLDEELKSATEDFVAEHLESKRAAQLIRYSVAEIKNRLVRETFEEQLVLSVGPMNQAHALLVFDKSFAQEVEHRWKQIKAMTRLLQVGGGSGVVLLLLTTLFGYFRLDTATKGYYTGRLQFMAAAAILALVAASVLFVKWIPWL